MNRAFVVIITGPPGVGKTWLGKWLAKELGIPFIGKDDIRETTTKTCWRPFAGHERKNVTPALLAPFRHRAFRLLFGGQIVSDLGDWLDFLALIALIVSGWKLGPSALAALSEVVTRFIRPPGGGDRFVSLQKRIAPPPGGLVNPVSNYSGDPLPGRLLRKWDLYHIPFPEDVYEEAE